MALLNGKSVYDDDKYRKYGGRSTFLSRRRTRIFLLLFGVFAVFSLGVAMGPLFTSNNTDSVETASLEMDSKEKEMVETIAEVPDDSKYPNSDDTSEEEDLKDDCCEEKDQMRCLACHMGISLEEGCMIYPLTKGCENIPLLTEYRSLEKDEEITFDPLEGGLQSTNRITFSLWALLYSREATLLSSYVATDVCENKMINFSEKDGFLHLSWQSLRPDGSCKLKYLMTEEKVVEKQRWHQVGFVLDFESEWAQVFLDGRSKHLLMEAELNEVKKSNLRGFEDRKQERLRSFTLGGFNGRVSDMRLYSGKFKTALEWTAGETSLFLSPYLSEAAKNLRDFELFSYQFDHLSRRVVNTAANPNYFSDAYVSPVSQRNEESDSSVKGYEDDTSKGEEFESVNGAPNNMNPFGEAKNQIQFNSLQEFEDFVLNSVSTASLIDGSFENINDGSVLAYSQDYGKLHKETVREAMRHAYSNYERYAFGKDELQPISGNANSKWGGHAVTMVDSLDTLWLMGFKDEFYKARDYVRDQLSFNLHRRVSFFETTIRDLGGLLSAFYLSNDHVFLEKAKDLGDRLIQAFRPGGKVPLGQINLATGDTAPSGWLGGAVMIAEIGTCQLEFSALSHLTGDKRYEELALDAVRWFEQNGEKRDGLFPIFLDPQTGKPKRKKTVTFGAMGDSYYEYLLKVWVQSGFKRHEFRGWYDESMDGMVDKLLKTSSPSKLSFVADWNLQNGVFDLKMDHLVCFLPGALALGAHHASRSLNPDRIRMERDLTVAKKLMYTCYEMYERMETGIAAEFVQFKGSADFIPGANAHHYLLRPETVESLFILHQVTKHPIYRIWGKKIMDSIEKFCRAKYGYAALDDVNSIYTSQKDSMESFFFAETLKYLYLLQSEETLISLDEWVFNTEAHPMKIQF